MQTPELEAAFAAPNINYNNLMSCRIRKVMLICSSYDSFALEEDGHLEAQINSEYSELGLTTPPSFTMVRDADEAMELLRREADFDLIITMLNIGQCSVFEFAEGVKQISPQLPVVLLYHFSREVSRRLEIEDLSNIDYVFCWMGNIDLIFAIVKLLEDSLNADIDINEVGVHAILLVEDSVKYYSTYLPMLYKQVLQQSHELLKEALNEHQQRLRRRARPKILLGRCYNEAVAFYNKYSHNFLGVISDVSFKRDMKDEEPFEGGIELCKLIRGRDPMLPFVLQSSKQKSADLAADLGVGFIYKYSKTLLEEISDYITNELMFGPFVFRDPHTGEEIARANDLMGMQKTLATISDEVLLYHSSKNHLSKWMFARGLFVIAEYIKTVRNNHFRSAGELRHFLIKEIKDYRSLLGQGVIAHFEAQSYNNYIWFARMGGGSLGGKARGLAFLNSMVHENKLYNKFDGVRISIPRTVVVATDYFDDFILENGLSYIVSGDFEDDYILLEFTGARLPDKLIAELRAYIKNVRGPLAVRSSSKLEDSYCQPFAGIYSTYMICRTDDDEQMLRQLSKAIKSVYASVYFKSSRAYIFASSNLISEEKMAVILQEVCGTEQDGLFFPTLSGVARSVNFYPIGDEKPQDGVANIAFGLGKMVVDGGQTLRFSPKSPKKVLQLSSPEMALRDTQRQMYALSLNPQKFRVSSNDAVNLEFIDVQQMAFCRNMRYVSSVWDMNNGTISDSPMSKGRKVITFANILKYDSLPLAEIIRELLFIGKREMRSEVEIEFAVNMDVPKGHYSIFNILQIRPIVEEVQYDNLSLEHIIPNETIIYGNQALGMGRIRGLSDIIYVPKEAFAANSTKVIAAELEQINSRMREMGLNYILVGPGRWGSADPWLGVPIKWSQISEARVIVECGLPDFRVDPSQGTHFFQNLTSFGVGYITINPFMGDGSFDEELLNGMEAVESTAFLRHVRFNQELFVFVDGKNNVGVVQLKDLCASHLMDDADGFFEGDLF